MEPDDAITETLRWVIAARRQLDRWERLIALNVLDDYRRMATPPVHVSDRAWRTWDILSERHFALIALNHVCVAVRETDGKIAPVPADLATEFKQLRDLNEHRIEHVAAFADRQNPGPLTFSAPDFAGRHPGQSPIHSFFASNNTDGPMLGPGVPAKRARDELDRIETEIHVYGGDRYQRFVPPPAASPWWGDEAKRSWEFWGPRVPPPRDDRAIDASWDGERPANG